MLGEPRRHGPVRDAHPADADGGLPGAHAAPPWPPGGHAALVPSAAQWPQYAVPSDGAPPSLARSRARPPRGDRAQCQPGDFQRQVLQVAPLIVGRWPPSPAAAAAPFAETGGIFPAASPPPCRGA